METRYLKTLVAVVESGSFSRAAKDICITQSAVSQRIKFLEDQFGVQLLKRSGAAFAVTDAGLLVTTKARQMLSLEKELAGELLRLEKKEKLALCCTPTFGIVYLPMVLNRFFLANSDAVDLKFVLSTPELALQGLQRGEFEVAVIEHCHQLALRDALSHELPPDELVFISAPALGIGKSDVTIEELLQQRLIARRVGCSSRCLLEENLALSGRSIGDFKGMIVHDDLHLTLQDVLSGRGIAYVSSSLVKDSLASGILNSHQVAGFHNFRSRTIVLNPRRSEEPLLREFTACISAVFAL